MAWPEGSKPFDAEALVRRARACNLAAKQDEPQNLEEAMAVLGQLSEYVDSLPTEKQSIIAKQLVSALGNSQVYKSSVAPKRSVAGAEKET